MDIRAKSTVIAFFIWAAVMILAFSCSSASAQTQQPIISKMTIGMFFADDPSMSQGDNVKYRAEVLFEYADIVVMTYYSALRLHQLPEASLETYLKTYLSLSRSVLIMAADRMEKDYRAGKILSDQNFCISFAMYFFPALESVAKRNGLDKFILTPNPHAKGNL